jgi:hypothetical protein
MKQICQTAHWLIAALAALSLFPVTSIAAQTVPLTSTIKNWTNPGEFPLQGDFIPHGGELLESDVYRLYDDVVTPDQFGVAVDQFERGIWEEYYLQDGDIIQVSFTVGEVDRVKLLRVWFGETIPPDHPTRRAQVYNTGRADGLKFVLPDICGNWSLMTFEPESPVKVVEATEPVQSNFQCRLTSRHSHGIGGEIIFYQTVGLNDCNETHIIPGYAYQNNQLSSQGHGVVCDWVNR